MTNIVLRTDNHGRMRTTLPFQLLLRGASTLLETKSVPHEHIQRNKPILQFPSRDKKYMVSFLIINKERAENVYITLPVRGNNTQIYSQV